MREHANSKFPDFRLRNRTARGRADAKANGVKFGRKPKLTPHQKREAIKRRDKDGETAEAEMDFRLFQQSLRTEEIRSVQAMMSHCKYWYSSRTLQTFLVALQQAPGDVPAGGLTQDQHQQLRFSAKYGALCAPMIFLRCPLAPPRRSPRSPRPRRPPLMPN